MNFLVREVGFAEEVPTLTDFPHFPRVTSLWSTNTTPPADHLLRGVQASPHDHKLHASELAFSLLSLHVHAQTELSVPRTSKAHG